MHPMIQKLYLALSIALSVLLCTNIQAQENDPRPLPNDPRIKTGKLANGLTYYIMKNTAVKGHADFAVGQKVGTVLENGNQKGMCRMLELLSTRGTRNFTDSTIMVYLNTLGLGAKDIRFETGEDEIIYTLENVPVANQNTIDSTLLVLYNWMSSINIDEEDVAKTMPMLKNTLIEKWDAKERIEEMHIKQLYPRSPYAKAITPQQINELEPYSSKELRNFYYKWFRPDLQAVFIVGDVDPSKIETQIKSIFATIPKPLKSEKRNYYTPKLIKGTEVVINTDPEYDKTTVAINFQRKPLPDKYKLTNVPYIEDYFDYAVNTLLYGRIQSGIVNENLPITNVRIEKGKFLEMANMETFTISFETLPGALYSAIAFMSGEINVLATKGFSNQEFINSKDNYFSELDLLHDNRFSQPNSLFMQRVKNHYFKGTTLASIELHHTFMKEILYGSETNSGIRLRDLNGYAAALLGQKEGVAILCSMPKVDGIDKPSVERIQTAFVNTLSKTDYSNVRKEKIEWPKFALGEGNASIIAENYDPLSGVTMFNLSNGINVAFKKTQGSLDTLSFKAVSKGGLSMSGADLGRDITLYISDIANLSTVGGFPRSTWDKLFIYNNMSMQVKINDHMEELYGYTKAANMEKFFHLINMNFTQRQSDYNSFDIYKRGKSYEALYRKLSPVKVFEDSVQYYAHSNKRFLPAHSKEYVDQIDYYKVQEVINQRLANPADFLFIFAGNVEVDRIRENIVKYLCPMPAVHDPEDWFTIPDYATKGKVERRFLHQMVIPQTFVDMTLSCGMQVTQQNVILTGLLKELLSSECSKGTIKELSPKNSVSADLKYYPEEMMVCKLNFVTDSAGAQPLVDIVKSKLETIAYNGIPAEEFNSLIESFRQREQIARTKNSCWIEALAGRHLLGKDLISGYSSAISSITPQMFKDFVDKIYRRGNMISVVMEGTTHDVNTQNLFRENQFIRDFFDL